MPRADFETHPVIQQGTYQTADNEGVMQANVTYVASALGDNVMGAGGQTGGVIKYQRNYSRSKDREADSESPRLYADREHAERHEQDRHMLTRAVASSALDKVVGLNAITEEKFGVDANGRAFGLSVMADGEGVQSNYRVNPGEDKVPCVLEANYRSPVTQRGLSDLEVSDYLSGQLDRHTGNIFVDPASGKVTGIDNDLAFPSMNREDILQRESTNWGATDSKAVAGFPRQMHEDTKAKILAVSPAELRATLSGIVAPDATENQPGRLTPAEIDGACERLAALQAELRSPDCGIQVVPEFNDATYDAAVDAQKAAFDNVRWKNADAGQTFDNCTAGGICDLAPKTSYLGAVVLKEKQTAVYIATEQQRNLERQAEGLPPQPMPVGVRPAVTAPKAALNQAYAEYTKMAEVAKQAIKTDPTLLASPADARQIMGIKEQMNEVKAKIAHYDNETAKLERGGLGAKFRSLASGGTEGRKEFYADKKLAAQQDLAALGRQLDAAAAEAVPVAMKQQLMNDAQAVVAARQPVVAQNNAVQQPVAVQPNPALAGMVPNHPAPPPPGQFNHPPPSDMAPAIPDQDNLAQNNDQPKAAKTKIAAKNKEEDLTVKAAEDELEVSDPDDLDADVEVEVEVKKEGLSKAPSVAEMLKRTNSAPQLGGHKAAQGVSGEEPKPAGNSLRASGNWQAAKPSGPKPGGGSLSASQH
ncbi:hypothetical protein [Prosthecobacter sp.]|jgi:hypothetical protein|uniref:hypothetical protein n=1 Tax=Prosthecobacter sp. TaxID=1965333 RepID=UPI0037C7DF10